MSVSAGVSRACRRPQEYGVPSALIKAQRAEATDRRVSLGAAPREVAVPFWEVDEASPPRREETKSRRLTEQAARLHPTTAHFPRSRERGSALGRATDIPTTSLSLALTRQSRVDERSV